VEKVVLVAINLCVSDTAHDLTVGTYGGSKDLASKEVDYVLVGATQLPGMHKTLYLKLHVLRVETVD
jgi:hypothetical protein